MKWKISNRSHKKDTAKQYYTYNTTQNHIRQTTDLTLHIIIKVRSSKK